MIDSKKHNEDIIKEKLLLKIFVYLVIYLLQIKQVLELKENVSSILEIGIGNDFFAHTMKWMGYDLGVNNISAIVSNDSKLKPLIINGRPLKSMNQFFNKEKSKLMSYIGDRGTSKRIEKLTQKRNNKINDFMHKTYKMIVEYALNNQIATIVIGKNDGWKQEVKIGKRNNQNFVQIL